MKLLLLAAGMGTRISHHIPDIPKCMVDIGGINLIKYTVNLFKENGIKDIAIVLGYRHEIVRQELAGDNIQTYYNPFFDITNSIASLWFARDFIQGDRDIMIMNADVFLESALVDVILSTRESPVFFADGNRRESADYKFCYQKNILLKHGKELKGQDITGEYVGIAKLQRDFIKTFLAQLEEMIGQQKHSAWWENVLYELIKEREIYVKDIKGSFWAEVDTIEDYERILKFRNNILEDQADIPMPKLGGVLSTAAHLLG